MLLRLHGIIQFYTAFGFVTDACILPTLHFVWRQQFYRVYMCTCMHSTYLLYILYRSLFSSLSLSSCDRCSSDHCDTACGQTPSIMDLPISVPHSGAWLYIWCSWFSNQLPLCMLTCMDSNSLSTQLAPYVAQYFPESFEDVGKYVSCPIP